MNSNNLLALILVTLYGVLKATAPEMNFNDANYVMSLLASAAIAYFICFKLVK